MDEILDFNEMNKLEDHLLVKSDELEATINLLIEKKIDHKVRKITHSIDENNVFSQSEKRIALSDANYMIQVPKNKKIAVNDLLKIKLKDDASNASKVRKLFLQNALDKEGLIEILAYPEDWEIGDFDLAKELLEEMGSPFSTEKINQLRIEKGPKPLAKKSNWPGIILLIGVLLLLLMEFLHWYSN